VLDRGSSPYITNIEVCCSIALSLMYIFT